MNSWEHSGFNVFMGEAIAADDRTQLLYTARYQKKCPVSNKRLAIIELPSQDARVEYSSFKNGETQVRSFTPLEFLAELQCAIPDTWEQTTRWLEAYSARSRGAATEPGPALTTSTAPAVALLPEPELKPSANYARLMKKIFELEPLTCPRCGCAMNLKAFITNPDEIARITKNLGIPPQRAPPPLRYKLPLAA
jgi:hypothetical protein